MPAANGSNGVNGSKHVPTPPEPPNFKQEVAKRAVLIMAAAYASWAAMYLMFGTGFIVGAGVWLVATIGYFVWVEVSAGTPLFKAVIKSTMQTAIPGPIVGVVINCVGAYAFLAASLPLTLVSLGVSAVTELTFLQVWFSLYVVAVGLALISKPQKVYDLEEAKRTTQNGGGKTVVVVGGGMAGIVAAKECIQNGLEVVLIEKSSHLGGVWASGGASKRAWSTIFSTSSTFNTQFSDFAMSDFFQKDRKTQYPLHFSRDEYMDYLDGYVSHFGVDKVAEMNSGVVSIVPAENGKQGKGWTVTSENGSGEKKTRHFDFVAVCTGLAHCRKEIKLEGQDKFVEKHGASAVTHSEFFNGTEPYKGKDTVVVGAGETSSDIAADLAAAGNTVHVIQRSPTLWLARHMPQLPPDYQEQYFLFMVPRFFRVLRFSLPAYPGWLMSKLMPAPDGAGDTSRSKGYFELHIKQTSFHPKSKGWSTSLTQGKQLQVTKAATISEYLGKNCHIWPHDIKCCDADGVVLSDPAGTHLPCQRIIHAYGYQQSYPFLPKDFHTTVNHDRYYYVFHPELQNIGWIGTVRGGIGSIPMGAEMQARWFALVAKGERPLPSQDAMREAVRKHKELWAARGNNRWATEVTTVYAKFLARHFVRCEPDLLEIFLWDPLAGLKVYASTMSPSMFRFRGPHATPELSSKLYRESPCEMQLGYVFAMGFFSLASYPLFLCLRFLPRSLVGEFLPAFEGYV